MRKVTSSKVTFEEGFSSGTVERTGNSITVHLDVKCASGFIRPSFTEGEFTMFRGLVLKAVEAIEVSK